MKRRSFKLISVAGMVLIAMFVLARAATAASYTYTTIDTPTGSGDVDARGINNSGQIAGNFNDINGFVAFVYSGGRYTLEFQDPNGEGSTYAYGINNDGDIVGSYDDSNGYNHGYELNPSSGTFGTFTEIDDPNGVQGTSAMGINDSGEIVGSYTDSSGGDHGFLYSGGKFTRLDDPNGGTGTYANGINDNGDIVGYYADSSGGAVRGFLYNGGTHTYTDIDYPNGVQTVPFGINDSGDIVGYYTDNNGAYHGFLYSDGTYSPIHDPSAGTGQYQGTEPSGINVSGDIAGTYIDSSGVAHGFLAVPKPGSLLQNATSLGGDWYYLSPFGFFYNTPGSAWIYHQTLGWLCTYGTSPDSIWIWDPQWDGTGGWWWTRSSSFPWIYSATEGEWFYYDADAPGSQPKAFYRWFWNPAAGSWEVH